MEASVLNRAVSEVSTESDQAHVQYIEMQESRTSTSPPVFPQRNVITAQPQAEFQQPRRVIPINTMDWISTPRSQLSALSGSHFLGNVEQLEIQQVVDLSTLLGRSERKFQYRVKVPKAETLFLAMDMKPDGRSNDWSCMKFVHNDFALQMVDQSGETAFVMKVNSRWTCTLNKLHKITVGSSNLIGTVEENFGLIGSSFTVYDATRNELCNIYGPNVCGCCMYQEAQFQVISIDGTHQIASLMHQWDNTLCDYTLLITFPAETNIKLKSLLLAAAFLVEHMFFERVKRSLSRT